MNAGGCPILDGYSMSERAGTRRALLLSAALSLAAAPAAAPQSLLGGRLRLGGEVSGTLSPEDEGYFNYSDYQTSQLRLFRVELAAEAVILPFASVLADVRSDNLGAPRVYALYLRLASGGGRAALQAGLVPPVFGAFPRRRYAYDNPLPSVPLAYQYLTTVRYDAVPSRAEQVVAQRGRGWLVRYPVGEAAAEPGLPLVNAERWDAGVQLRVGSEPLSLALAVTQGSPSHPRVEDDNDGKQVSGRLQWRAGPAFTAGVSGASGEYLSSALVAQLPAAARRGYRQDAAGLDLEWQRGTLDRARRGGVEPLGAAGARGDADRGAARVARRLRRGPLQAARGALRRGAARAPGLRPPRQRARAQDVGRAGHAPGDGRRLVALPARAGEGVVAAQLQGRRAGPSERPRGRTGAAVVLRRLALAATLVLVALPAAPQPARRGATIRGRVELKREPAATEARPAVSDLGPHAGHDAPDRRRSVVYLETAPQPALEPPLPGRAVLDQRNQTFVPYVLAVTVGSVVEFPNSDRTYHNVFSLSKAKRFDLGRYPRGQSRSVRFDQPGVVRVFCEIHSHMSAWILVFAHPYFAVTDAEGRYRIDGVPPGSYTLAVWNDGSVRARRELRVSSDGEAVEADAAVE